MTSKIAVNARFQYRRVTGVERYAQEISKRMNPKPRMIAPQKALGQISGHLWEQFVLPFLIPKNEILWSPANTSAWSIRNQVVTIHDASVFEHPEWFRPVFAAWTKLAWKILAKRARAIITVSKFSRERLRFYLKVPEQKIHVIHNGVGDPFKLQTQRSIETAKEKYNLHKPYFLFVGTHEPRKNLVGLIQAWESLNLKSHSLFVAGMEGKVFAPAVSYTGSAAYVSDEDLPALYSGATAVVAPSFHEGFGLTVLEAMACGAPVIASDTTSFPETAGDAAIFFNPNKIEEIKNAMLLILENPGLAKTLREHGFQRASQFTWDESARKTQSLLESLL